MIKKLPVFSGVARPGAAPRARAKAYYRGVAGASVFSALTPRPLPATRVTLACRWQIDPMTGSLVAIWVKAAPDADSGARADAKADEAQRRPLPSHLAARGYALRSRIAAKQAAWNMKKGQDGKAAAAPLRAASACFSRS